MQSRRSKLIFLLNFSHYSLQEFSGNLTNRFQIRFKQNFLLQFSGKSLPDCSAKDLKSLIDTLKIDIKNLESSTTDDSELVEDFFEADEEASDDHNDATSTTPSPILDGHKVRLTNAI
jgi:hypothetical protein